MRRRLFELILCGSVAGMATTASAQISVSALLSMVGRNLEAETQSNITNFGVTPFDATYARLFVDAQVTERLSAFLQWFAHDYDGAFFYGGYVRYDHTPDFHLEAGLIPVPVGLWGQRTYADKNPLVSAPAMFQYKSAVSAFQLQTSAEDILSQRGLAENTPMVYDFCWNTGLHAYASHGPVDFGIALTNGSLAIPRRDVIYGRPNVVLHLNWVTSPYLTVGAWGAIGPYLSPHLEYPGPSGGYTFPPGKEVEDYNQTIFGGLAQAAAGHLDVVAEGAVNRFEHPFLGDLKSVSGYADITYRFATRWWIAGRFDAMSFSELELDGADGERWDYPLVRLEGGIGRRLSEKSLIKAVTQIIRYQDAPPSLDGEVFAVQFTVEL